MKNTNIAAITGFWSCFCAILFGIATNGGIATIMNFIHFPSLIVTLCGSLFAVLITADSFGDYINSLRSFIRAFQKSPITVDEVSEQILSMSDISRKEGLLSLDEQLQQLPDSFLSKGLRLVIDGTNPELVKDILETEMLHTEEQENKDIRFWRDLGACAPAWGMVGTLLGLINMMRSMGTDATAIGSGMALALITTLYGSVISNWICIPIARKLEKNCEQKLLIMEVVTEGVLSIQAGENPRIIKEKIVSILTHE